MCGLIGLIELSGADLLSHHLLFHILEISRKCTTPFLCDYASTLQRNSSQSIGILNDVNKDTFDRVSKVDFTLNLAGVPPNSFAETSDSVK